MNLEKVLEKFLNGETDIIDYFGDLDTFFDTLKKKNIYHKIDLEKIDSDEFQNEFLLWLFENDRQKYYYYIKKFLGDVEFDSETNKPHWIGDRADLADLFCSGRNDISQETVKEILSDDGDWYERWWDTTEDVYRDVIEELNQENIERLKEYMVSNLKGQQISPESEEMELIASEQGHNDYWEMNSDVVARIIDDEQSMNSLLDDELSDLKSELFSVHSNAYNSAYEEEIYNSVFSELNSYFDGQGTWISKPHPFKKDTVVTKYKIPISDLEGVVNDYLYSKKGYGNQGTLEYQGSFLNILKEERGCLSVHVPDYPDYSNVDKNINMYFRDYI